jgi:hypothetical protein
MLRRSLIVTALAAGLTVAAITVATPALAKGPTVARITGAGLVHAVVVSGKGEPGQQGKLAALAEQTYLFTLLFGPGGSVPTPTMLPSAPSAATLGPRYVVTYTVPGVTTQANQQVGRIRQDLYPLAAGGPVIYTPPGQRGFGRALHVTGWFRGSPGLLRTLAGLGVPTRPGQPGAQQTRGKSAGHPAAGHQAGSGVLAWLIASGAAIAAVALIATALWLRRRKPVIGEA